MRDARSPNVVRFGPFELDLKAGELHKEGQRLLLQEQPFQVLKMLLANPGDVLTREEIRKKLWPNDTAVEFDRSINAAVKKLRIALGDSAEEPLYVETVARRGYRFIVPVELVHTKPLDAQFAGGCADVGAPPPPRNLTGKKVSHYRLLEILGGGGMGVVYKAEDLKLGRQVAIKFLPEELTGDAKALERFEREARTASSLDHPNICAIYEFGEQDGHPFIVMQLLEGQTLRDRIAVLGPGARDAASTQTGPFAIDQLIDLAIQIIEGLEAAHGKGVIHRDIKPANIFVVNRGQAKILDFGLAKLNEGTQSPAPVSDAQLVPPGDPNLTRTGAAMGTAAYMSPEQVMGEKLDARSDLFSFGLVLYEMATGQQAFTGDTVALVHQAILNGIPAPARDLNAALPPSFAAIISKATEKDRSMRYQTASEVRTDLERLKREIGSPPSRRLSLVLVGILFILLFAGGTMWLTKRQTVSVSELKQRQLTANSSENPVEEAAISPDGKYLAYSDLKGIHIKLIAAGETQTIPEPEDLKGTPVDWIVNWFPDSTRLLLTAHLSAQRPSAWVASVMGGALRKIRDDAWAWAVSPDGASIIFTTKPGKFGNREMWLMGPNGEEARMLYETDDSSSFERIEWSPDSQRITYTRSHQAPDKLETIIESRDLKGGPVTTILSSGPWWQSKGIRDSKWLPGGRLIYLVGEQVIDGLTCNYWELRVDPQTGEPRGKPRRLTHWAGFCMDYTTATADGKQLAFTRGSTLPNVYLANLDAEGTHITSPHRLTQTESQEFPAAWTPDSKSLVFTSDRNGLWGIFKQSLDKDTPEFVAPMPEGVDDVRVSPDGAWTLSVVPPTTAGSAQSVKLMRVPITGGSPQLVFAGAGYNKPSCSRSPATLCAITERAEDYKELIFTAFDPVKGRGRELTRMDVKRDAAYTWDLSPDANRIAVLRLNDGRIRVLSLIGQLAQDITVKGWSSLQSVDWTTDGKGLFVASAGKESSVLLYVDLQGNAHVVWEHGGWGGTRGIPSPDGRHLAMLGVTHISNVWVIENF